MAAAAGCTGPETAIGPSAGAGASALATTEDGDPRQPALSAAIRGEGRHPSHRKLQGGSLLEPTAGRQRDCRKGIVQTAGEQTSEGPEPYARPQLRPLLAFAATSHPAILVPTSATSLRAETKRCDRPHLAGTKLPRATRSPDFGSLASVGLGGRETLDRPQAAARRGLPRPAL